ncbi:hypothetical protein [Bradyrhizobium elkanii]|jgi:hypothetical protein|uniref:hypothetical protein n=1 Tax=Bradyrhizobium elkanii TaxID=29448 RepID=UPI0014495179|nr:hypothetical protein [Bradyrhizobium elkanii]MCP1932528.1 hypothetical protein [Bradyrhizobium elkanii]MCS3479545.1 hypothetical protein [Bradyrhizobium elkanii]MCS3576930.1 hypothetical protein [Bradyrhizobium elkanii]MCS3719807.1 hypothetical protein [Bradyrhizobium elkanii]MCS4004224.1 hypothetical protein [Bradyrhizobium elkanii USDA 61]
MIRDPSDGTVREPKKPDIGIPTSGLAPPDKDQINEAARLKRSREWLEEYYKRRGAE